MLKKVAAVLVACAWAFMVFLCVGTLTFPGDAVADRAEYAVHSGSKKAYTLKLGDVGPWWMGLSTDQVQLYGKKSRKGEQPLLVLATDARAAVSPFSMMMLAPSASGSVTLGTEGLMYYDVGTRLNDDWEPEVTDVELNSDAFPLAEVLTMISAYEGSATGALDLDVDLTAPEGLSKADGTITLRGKDMVLIKPVVSDFPIGEDVEIRNLDIELDAKEGRAKVDRGTIETSVANVEITGTVDLKDAFGQSTVDWRLEVTLDESKMAFKSFFKKAMVGDKIVYRCSGRISNLARACKPGEGKKKTTKRSPRIGRDNGKAARPRPAALSKEDKEKRRAELQERLRKRREKNAASGRERPKRPKKAEDDALDDDELDEDLEEEDEEIADDDELVVDDEEFVEE